MIIKREITNRLKAIAGQFPVVAVMGPRQSGKTTLVRETFKHYRYVSMEDLDRRAAAQQDPRGFFASFVNDPGVIIDEIQEVPELFSYMQGVVDEKYRPGFFIVTGSQQFSMHEKITQTLAGRIALLTLLPLSVNELKEAHLLPAQINSLFIKGFYPRVYAQNIEFELWFSNYISTYVEKDVRQVLQIADVVTFQRFLKLVAARVGNLVNYADLARDADISPNTAKAWLSVLEASYIIKLVAPYYKNFNKRVIKSPKLYFYDTALVCALLGIKESDVPFHPLRGALFESFVVSELFKYNFNHVYQPQLYFWRDVQGHEIDCVIEKSLETVIPVEIKAGMTVTEDFFKGLIDWADITDQKSVSTYVVYGGNDYREYKGIRVFPWNVIAQMLDEVYK